MVTVERRGDVLVVACHGELDLVSRDALHADLQRLSGSDLDDVTAVVVDLADVPFMDCSAVGSMMMFAAHCDRVGVRWFLSGATGIVRRLLIVLELNRVWVVTATVDEALGLAEISADVRVAPSGAGMTGRAFGYRVSRRGKR